MPLPFAMPVLTHQDEKSRRLIAIHADDGERHLMLPGRQARVQAGPGRSTSRKALSSAGVLKEVHPHFISLACAASVPRLC